MKITGLTGLVSDSSIYPVEPSFTSSSIKPTGFITAEIPLFADLIIYFPLSIDLKILCAKCCLGPIELPNYPSSEILTMKSKFLFFDNFPE